MPIAAKISASPKPQPAVLMKTKAGPAPMMTAILINAVIKIMLTANQNAPIQIPSAQPLVTANTNAIVTARSIHIPPVLRRKLPGAINAPKSITPAGKQRQPFIIPLANARPATEPAARTKSG